MDAMYTGANYDISIHAPTRGATMYQSKIRHIAIDFNPRSHEGSDNDHDINYVMLKNFNPRSHEGSDFKDDPNYIKIGISIHAPTRGATVKISSL